MSNETEIRPFRVDMSDGAIADLRPPIAGEGTNMNDRAAAPRDMTSLQFLRYEDLRLQELLTQVRRDQNPVGVVDDRSRAASVERRYRYGQAAKQILGHLALRQRAAIDVAVAIRPRSELRATSDEIIDRATRCRALIDELQDILRSHPLMSLNAEGDFAPRLAQLAELAGATIHWELREGIPLIEKAINAGLPVSGFHDGLYVVRHARCKLNSGGPQWYERAPIVSRVLTVWDHFMGAGLFRHGCGPE